MNAIMITDLCSRLPGLKYHVSFAMSAAAVRTVFFLGSFCFVLFLVFNLFHPYEPSAWRAVAVPC